MFNDSMSTEADMDLGLQKSHSNSVPRNPVVPRAKFLYNEFGKCSFKKLLTAFSIFLIISVHHRRSNHYRRKSAITKTLLLLLCGIAGTTVAQWLRCCATNRKVAGSIPGCVSGFFIGVDSASNRNEYQEHFLRVKAAGT